MSAIASSLRAHSARASSSERSSRSTQRSRSLSSRSSRSTSAYAADSASAIAGALCIPAAGRRVAASSAILRLDISPSRRPSSSRALASICFTSRTSWSLTRARSRQRDDGSPASSSGSEVYGGGPAQRRTITRQSRLQSRWAASATRVRTWRVSICAIRMAVRSRRGLGSLRYQPHRARREQQVRTVRRTPRQPIHLRVWRLRQMPPPVNRKTRQNSTPASRNPHEAQQTRRKADSRRRAPS